MIFLNVVRTEDTMKPRDGTYLVTGYQPIPNKMVSPLAFQCNLFSANMMGIT